MKRGICGLLVLGLLLMPVHAKQTRYIALTFDDGPSGKYTERLLDGLSERGVRATFFLCGYRVEQYPELTAQIYAQGHEIGSHGDSHNYLTQLSVEEVCAELAATRDKIEAAAGVRPTLLRPPGGLFDADVLQKTVCADLPIILWSVDPEDWCCCRSEVIAQRVIGNIKSGDIVLLHDMSDSSVNAALRIVDALQAEGYEFLTVSELAERCGTELRGGTVYSRFSDEKNASISEREALSEP